VNRFTTMPGDLLFDEPDVTKADDAYLHELRGRHGEWVSSLPGKVRWGDVVMGRRTGPGFLNVVAPGDKVRPGDIPVKVHNVQGQLALGSDREGNSQGVLLGQGPVQVLRAPAKPVPSETGDEEPVLPETKTGEPALSPSLHALQMNPFTGTLSSRTLPHEMVAAIQDYMDPKPNAAINGALRGGKVSELPPVWQRDIEELDGTLAQFRTTKPYTAFRGIAMTPELEAKMKPGATFTDPGYVSLSDDPHIASGFAFMRTHGYFPWDNPDNPAQMITPVPNSKPVTLTINAPTGTHMIPGQPTIDEWVLPRGTKFHVDSVGEGVVQLSVVNS
jgi:ADP-ribosyltransferase exoenzyme